MFKCALLVISLDIVLVRILSYDVVCTIMELIEVSQYGTYKLENSL